MDIDIKELIKAVAEDLDLSNFKGDVVGVKIVENEIGNVEDGGIGIQYVYNNTKPKANQNKKTKEKKNSNGLPKTLKYYIHSNKSVLTRQRNRVNLVFKKWNEWGWLDNQTTANDFDAFFEGEPRHCNIVFKKNTTVLSVFLRDLLDYENSHKEKIISKQTGQSATSLVKEQFGKTENFDETRLTDDDKFKIEATLYILNTENPIVHRQGGDDNDYDTSDAAFQAVLSGQLRSTKGI